MNNFDQNKMEPEKQDENKSFRDEEYAAEFTPSAPAERSKPETISMYGWIGLALSVLSFFMWPLVFGVAGIILGFVSRSKGANMLGNFAIGAGIISIILSLLMLPF